MGEFKQLCERVAPILAGRPVTIRWQQYPASPTAFGDCVKTAAGEAIIYIRPFGPYGHESLTVDVLLHELGHWRAHADEIPTEHAAPADPSKSTRLGGANFQAFEDQADDWPDKWNIWIRTSGQPGTSGNIQIAGWIIKISIRFCIKE